MPNSPFAMLAQDTPVRAERLRPALQTRILGRAGLGDSGNYRALHLERGQALLRTPEGERTLVAPLMAWIPWGDTLRLDLPASASGSHLLLGRAALERALHHRPEAGQLRFLADRTAILQLDEGSTAQPVASCFNGILAETLRPAPLGAAVVESLLHVLLVLLFRGQPQNPQSETTGNPALASRFTALVEAHFRDHWTAQHYAARLGVSRDRLNDICLRTHGRPPGALIRARLHLEARRYLENAALSLDQIAGLLGFSAAPQFSRFFKAIEGVPPGRFRADLRARQRAGAPSPEPYAWP